MPYTLEEFAADCKNALSKGNGPAELEEVRTYVSKGAPGPRHGRNLFATRLR